MKRKLIFIMVVALITWGIRAALNPHITELDLNIDGVADYDEFYEPSPSITPKGPGGFVCSNGWKKITLKAVGVNDPMKTRLNWDSSKIEVWTTNGGTQVLSPTLWDPASDMPTNLWVKGVAVSATGPTTNASGDWMNCGPEHITLEAINNGAEPTTAPGTYYDRIAFTVVECDLDVDSNNDSVIDDTDDASEEFSPGMLILSNTDNDDFMTEFAANNVQIDNANERIDGSADRDDLREIRIRVPRYATGAYLYKTGAGKIRVFFDDGANGVVILGPDSAVSSNLMPYVITEGTTVPGAGTATFAYEGVTNGPVHLELRVFYGGVSPVCSDKVEINVLDVFMVQDEPSAAAGTSAAGVSALGGATVRSPAVYRVVEGTCTELASVLAGEASSHSLTPPPPPPPPEPPVPPYTDRPWVEKITMGGETGDEISAHLPATVIRIHGANFANGCTVAFANGLISVCGVSYVSPNRLDVTVRTDTEVFGQTALAVTNPDGAASGYGPFVRVGALYDAQGITGLQKGGYEVFSIIRKETANRIGYVDCAGISAFGGGTNTLTGDGHTSSGTNTGFAVALTNGVSYQVQLYFGHPTNATGPFTVKINGGVVATGLTTTGGEVRVVGATVAASNGLVNVTLESGTGVLVSVCGLRIHAADGEAFADLRHENYTPALLAYDFEGVDGLTVTGCVRVLPVVKTTGVAVGYADAAGISSFSSGPTGQLTADGHWSARTTTRLIADVPTNGTYRTTLSLFNPTNTVGPVAVWMNGRCVASNVMAPAGSLREVVGVATVTAGRVEMDLLNASNAVWGICGLALSEEWPTNMPANWVAGLPTTLAIGVKAGEFGLSGGTIRITVPDGFPAPTLSDPAAAGYVRVSCPDSVTVNAAQVSGREITLMLSKFEAGRLVEVLFGDRSGGGPGVTAGAAASYLFDVRTCGPGGTLLPAMAPGETRLVATGAVSGYCRVAGGSDYEEWPGYSLYDTDPAAPSPTATDPIFPLTTVGDGCRRRMMVVGEDVALNALLNLQISCEKADGSDWEVKTFGLTTTGVARQRITQKKILIHDGEVDPETVAYFEAQGYELLRGEGANFVKTKAYRGSSAGTSSSGKSVSATSGSGSIGAMAGGSTGGGRLVGGNHQQNQGIKMYAVKDEAAGIQLNADVCLSDYWSKSDLTDGAIQFRTPKWSVRKANTVYIEVYQALTKLDPSADMWIKPQPGRGDEPAGNWIKLGSSSSFGDFPYVVREGGGIITHRFTKNADNSTLNAGGVATPASVDTPISEPLVQMKLCNSAGVVLAGPSSAMFDLRSSSWTEGVTGDRIARAARVRQKWNEACPITGANIDDATEYKFGDPFRPPESEPSGDIKVFLAHGVNMDGTGGTLKDLTPGGRPKWSWQESGWGAGKMNTGKLIAGSGKEDAEVTIVLSCMGLGDADKMDIIGTGQHSEERDHLYFENGIHMVLGFESRVHSNLNPANFKAVVGEDAYKPLDEKLKDFLMDMKKGKKIREAWLENMASAWYYRNEGRTSARAWREIPRVIACNLGTPSVWEQQLPLGDEPVAIAADIKPAQASQITTENRVLGDPNPPDGTKPSPPNKPSWGNEVE
jgi:hypothetical protein